MKKWIFCLLLGGMSGFNAYSQSFTNIDELLQLSEMDPLECEKTLTSKSFSFVETDGITTKYSAYNEALSYRISPRRVSYRFRDRLFFLEVNSRLIKQGFVLVSSEGVLEDEGTTVKAQQYEKGKFTVWLFTSEESSPTQYNIQIDNSEPSSVKKASSTSSKPKYNYKGDKESISHGYFYIALINPRGIITEAPQSNTTYAQDYSGVSGIGAKKGFEFGLGGVVGFDGLNKHLPHALDLGVILNGNFGIQPFSYESLGTPYDDYIYNGFIKVGGGIGPCLELTPFANADFHLSFFYRIDAGANFGGTFDYNGSESFDESMTRDAASFTWIKTFGINLHGGSLFGGIDFSNYTDNGAFTLTQSYYDPVMGTYVDNQGTLKAQLPVRQITLKIGVQF